LDGVVDADKIDYLIRDARNCNITYPSGIDIERFLKCITTITTSVEEEAKVRYMIRLGIKEKGLAAAEFITEARQKMYQASYLQHTARCVKSMILYACYNGLRKMINSAPEDLDPSQVDDNILITLYTNFILGIDNPDLSNFELKDGEAIKKIWRKITNTKNEFLKAFSGFDLSIGFFYGHMSKSAKQLLKDSLKRPAYQRLAEISLSDITENGKREKLRKSLQWSNRERILNAIEKEFIEIIENKINSGTNVPDFLKIPSNNIRHFFKDKILLVADIPSRDLGPGGDSPPPVLKDIARKTGRYKHDKKQKSGHIWEDGMVKMMSEVTVCRIFCEPLFFSLVKELVGQTELSKIIRRRIKGWPALS
jgi:HD superfamily phosphohydrolase